jgi:hypothetical protein
MAASRDVSGQWRDFRRLRAEESVSLPGSEVTRLALPIHRGGDAARLGGAARPARRGHLCAVPCVRSAGWPSGWLGTTAGLRALAVGTTGLLSIALFLTFSSLRQAKDLGGDLTSPSTPAPAPPPQRQLQSSRLLAPITR